MQEKLPKINNTLWTVTLNPTLLPCYEHIVLNHPYLQIPSPCFHFFLFKKKEKNNYKQAHSCEKTKRPQTILLCCQFAIIKGYDPISTEVKWSGRGWVESINSNPEGGLKGDATCTRSFNLSSNKHCCWSSGGSPVFSIEELLFRDFNTQKRLRRYSCI